MKLPAVAQLFANDSEDPDPEESGRASRDCEDEVRRFLAAPALHSPVKNGGRCKLRPRGKNAQLSPSKAAMIKTFSRSLIGKLDYAKGLLAKNVPKPVGSRRTRMSPDFALDAGPFELSSRLGSKIDRLDEY